MRDAEPCLLVQLLRRPELAGELDAAQWDLLIRQARHANLLARLDHLIEPHGGIADLPHPVQRHLLSARRFAAAHARVVRWEVNRIQRALSPLDVPVVLLKGAAYLMIESPAAGGRVFSDVDILVPKARLAEVEEALYWAGWLTTHHDAYDQRYYRQWMHEIPPLKHLKRRTVLDVHHTILPETARLHPDPRLLFDSAQPVAGEAGLYVLCVEDRILHSATHLFHDGEFEHGLRDLVDLDALLRQAADADPAFWDRLLDRAERLQLSRPLAYALRYCRSVLATPIPGPVIERMEQDLPGPALIQLMDALLRRALRPDHDSCDDTFTSTARGMLYLRGHYLRMPLHLLVPHLLRKSLRREPAESQR